MTPGSKTLLLCLMGLVCAIYLRYYLSPNPKLEILQTSISQLQPQLLFEKLPIILNEGIVDPLDLVRKVFRFLYIYKKHITTFPQDTWVKNKARYLVVYSLNPDGILGITHPKNPKHHIHIKLSAHKCIILPTSWSYNIYSHPQHFKAYELYDMTSILLQPVNKK